MFPARAVSASMIAMIVLVSCASLSTEEIPAVFNEVTNRNHQILKQAVEEALNQKSILLSPDAMTRSSLLIIDRKKSEGLSSIDVGRRFGRPHRFRLVIDRGKCTLVQLDADWRQILRETHCRPE